jgi:excisionase family DNA binding protein
MAARRQREPRTRDREDVQARGSTYTVNQAWDRLGRKNITRQAVYLAAARGDFPAIRLGRRILIPRESFERFLLGAQAAKEPAA